MEKKDKVRIQQMNKNENKQQNKTQQHEMRQHKNGKTNKTAGE